MVTPSMSPEERLLAAIGHRPVDRLPCAPLLNDYAARFARISDQEFLFSKEAAFAAMAAVKTRFPVWDIRRSLYAYYYGPHHDKIWVMRSKMPGIDSPADWEYQLLETEVMRRQDYRLILDKGLDAYLREFYRRAHGASDEAITAALLERQLLLLEEIAAAKACGQVCLYGSMLIFAGDHLSFTRSFPEFIRDLYQIPEVMDEVLEQVCEHQLAEHLAIVRQSGVPRVMIGVARMSGQFFSPTHFERFIWPFLKRYVDRFLAAGVTPFLHLDGNWNSSLPYLLELPPRQTVVELDGSSDIFLAKKLLAGHCCLLGDVPSTLFTLGTPQQVKKYCQQLISEVGSSGFIFSSGCTLPYLAKHNNVAAFFAAVESENAR